MTQTVTEVSLRTIEEYARWKLPEFMRRKLDGGFNDETTYVETEDAFAAGLLLPRRLTGVVSPDTSTTLLGSTIDLPVLPAPATPHFGAHPDAEVAVTRAAGRAGTIQIVPCYGHTSFAENAAAASGPLWAQIFCLKDRGQMLAQLEHLEQLDYRALVLTVDFPSSSMMREQESERPGLAGRGPGFPEAPGRGAGAEAQEQYEMAPGAPWEYLDWICESTALPVVLKGILRADMASEGISRGAAGIVVSSHGARLFDGQIASIEALAEVLDAVGDAAEVLFDGGIRTGADVVRVVAAGAKAVLIGRPIFYGLACGGEEGVFATFDALRREIAVCLRLLGRHALDSVDYHDVAF